MDDLISRQAAIDAAMRDVSDKRTHDFNEGATRAANRIKQLPSAQPEPQWIPVSERLPEENGRYLVTRGLNACGSLWNRTYIANYSDLMGITSKRIWWQGNVGKSDFEQFDDVLAWMSLPEPPKGEKE